MTDNLGATATGTATLQVIPEERFNSSSTLAVTGVRHSYQRYDDGFYKAGQKRSFKRDRKKES